MSVPAEGCQAQARWPCSRQDWSGRLTAEVSLAPVVAASTDALPRITELKQTLWSVGASLFDRARVAGVVRGDLTSDDMVPLMCTIAFAANVHDGDYAARAEVAQRYLTALLEGLHVQARR